MDFVSISDISWNFVNKRAITNITIVEIVGYAARIASSTEAPLFTDTPFIVQPLFLLLAPALFAASIYMELGRVVALLQAEQHTIVRKTWMTKIFVTGDILSFVTQGIGQ